MLQLDAIEHLCRVRPVLALFECSDGIEAHPHWRVLSAAMQLAGYKKIWSQDVAIHQLTSNHRTRWLAIWARNDIPSNKSNERILCSINHRLNWNDPKHLHSLPCALADDLILKPPHLEVYGSRDLLPPGKKARVGESATVNQVLDQMVIQQGEYLPTLCASYTAQHLLQREHLEAKGSFATLVHCHDQFRFVDPFVFISLFGTTDSIGIPSDLRTAFHQIGNAISQVHGLIAVLFAVESVTGESMQKLAIVQQCWEDRLTSEKALIRTSDDMYVLQPLADFVAKAIPSIVTWLGSIL